MTWNRVAYTTSLPGGGWDRQQIFYPMSFSYLGSNCVIVQGRQCWHNVTAFEMLQTYATLHIQNITEVAHAGTELLVFAIGY